MDNIFEMKQQQKAAYDRATALINTSSAAGRDLTAAEQTEYETAMRTAEALAPRIKRRESFNTIRNMMTGGTLIVEAGQAPDQPGFMQPMAFPPSSADVRTAEYKAALHSFLTTGGKAHGPELTAGADGVGGYYLPGSEAFTRQRGANGSVRAATYEGTQGSSDAAGGYAINVPTIQQIVPLAMPDLGIFDASLVVPTATDLKVPQQASFGTSALKSESTGTVATFGGADPTLGQVTLSAYMAGALRLASYELLQDVSMFQQFLVDDLLRGQRILEGSLLASGTGAANHQPTGVFGNTGTGTGAAYALVGTSADGVTLLDSLFDVTATLKANYQANASWLMSRATCLAIRRAQMQANLFVPVVTQDADGTTRILGRPVYFDVNSPALPTATTAGVIPILYGDFQQGNIIGVRGGAGINVKILDQPWAAQGQIGILAYRRLDSQIRISEAIQQIKFSHS